MIDASVVGQYCNVGDSDMNIMIYLVFTIIILINISLFSKIFELKKEYKDNIRDMLLFIFPFVIVLITVDIIAVHIADRFEIIPKTLSDPQVKSNNPIEKKQKHHAIENLFCFFT